MDGSGAVRTVFDAYISINGTIESGSRSLVYHRQGGSPGSASTNIIRTISTDDIIRITVSRDSGTNNGNQEPWGTQLTIKKLS